MTRDRSLSFRIRGTQAGALAKLSKATDRSKSWHLEQALSAYLELHLWQISRIEAGVADAEAGRLIAHDAVAAGLRRRKPPVPRQARRRAS